MLFRKAINLQLMQQLTAKLNLQVIILVYFPCHKARLFEMLPGHLKGELAAKGTTSIETLEAAIRPRWMTHRHIHNLMSREAFKG